MRRDVPVRSKAETRALPFQALVAASFMLLLGAALAVSAHGATSSVETDRATADNVDTSAQHLQLAQEAIDLGASAEEKIREVIESQLSAFQRDDASEAFSYASPGIQRLFGNPDKFIAMVKSGYRAVYRPSAVAFKEIRSFDDRPGQIIDFVGPDGEAVTAIYLMEQQPDGTWRIDGVYLLRQAQA